MAYSSTEYHSLTLGEPMNNKSIFFGLLTCTIVTTTHPMGGQGGFLLPTTFRFELPTKFSIKTAFDKLSVHNICQTLTFAAGITMLYKAGDLFAKSCTPFPDNVNPLPSAADRTFISHARRQASLRYLIAGCAITAAGFLQKYGSQILRQLPNLKKRIFRS